jgi:sugar lactone lactonase YvrE
VNTQTNTSVKAHILRDYKLEGWQERIAGRWSYRQLVADENWRKGWISFDAVTWNPDDRRLYCGLNSIDGDLLYTFDPRTSSFECLNTQQWADAFDSKIHRTLLRNPQDGCFYFGTSLLHDADQQHEAPGGKLVKYDPRARSYELLGIPFPHQYIQSIAADFGRGILYAFTYPCEFVVRFDLATRRSRQLCYVGNAIMFAQPHNAVVDKHGNLWGTYAETRAWDEMTGQTPVRLFKYNPESDRFTWFEHGLSRRDDKRQLIPDPVAAPSGSFLSETRHKQDYGFCDAMLYDGDRYIYAGTVAGVLSRIDVETGQVQKVANVIASGRFPAMAWKDGVLYGAGGLKGNTQVVRWPVNSERICDLGRLIDPQLQGGPARIHEMAVDDQGTLYLAENDNHQRSSYLWTVPGGAER